MVLWLQHRGKEKGRIELSYKLYEFHFEIIDWIRINGFPQLSILLYQLRNLESEQFVRTALKMAGLAGNLINQQHSQNGKFDLQPTMPSPQFCPGGNQVIAWHEVWGESLTGRGSWWKLLFLLVRMQAIGMIEAHLQHLPWAIWWLHRHYL